MLTFCLCLRPFDAALLSNIDGKDLRRIPELVGKLKSKVTSADVGAEIPLPSFWSAGFVTEDVTGRVVGSVDRAQP
jgi:hypothetical protein